jgi:predicted DNA-binding protein (MmcQ/YjbR family)
MTPCHQIPSNRRDQFKCEQYMNIEIIAKAGHCHGGRDVTIPDAAAMTSPFLTDAEDHLRAHALALPETAEEFPWGERVIKVRGKIFVFLAGREDGLRISMKLPHSREFALDLSMAQPTGYGLGKAGWVSFNFATHDEPDVERLKYWMLESYRAVAPKRLSALLGT